MEKKSPKLIIGAIIQARMGSSRLPGKVLMDIMGKPMLWYLINRLKFSKRINEIILAIPDTKENDILEKFAKKNKIKYFRGQEQDVLSRYYGAAKKFKADLIVRITSDSPLIDPAIVDQIIKEYFKNKPDYASNTIERTFPWGLDTEVFNFKVLGGAYRDAKEKYQREHVTPYIYEHPEIFKLYNVEAKRRLRRPNLRLMVDTKEDLDLARKIYKYLYNPQKIFYTKEIIDLFKKYPGLLKINSHIQHKKLKE